MTDRQTFLHDYPLGHAGQDATAMLAAFAKEPGWEGRYRTLILQGKALPVLPAAWRGSEQELDGCESTVWLIGEADANGRWHFAADSDARIVRGLLAVVLAAFNHQTAAAILAFDIDSYFEQLQLTKHLSPSRGNGLRAMVEAIRKQVQAG